MATFLHERWMRHSSCVSEGHLTQSGMWRLPAIGACLVRVERELFTVGHFCTVYVWHERLSQSVLAILPRSGGGAHGGASRYISLSLGAIVLT